MSGNRVGDKDLHPPVVEEEQDKDRGGGEGDINYDEVQGQALSPIAEENFEEFLSDHKIIMMGK